MWPPVWCVALITHLIGSQSRARGARSAVCLSPSFAGPALLLGPPPLSLSWVGVGVWLCFSIPTWGAAALPARSVKVTATCGRQARASGSLFFAAEFLRGSGTGWGHRETPALGMVLGPTKL